MCSVAATHTVAAACGGGAMEIREARGSSQNTAPSNSRRNRNLLRVNMRRNSAKRGFGARCAHYAAVASAAAFFRRRAEQRYARASRLARVQSRAVCALLRRRFLCKYLSGDGPGTRRLSPEAAGQSAGRHYRAARLVRVAAAAAIATLPRHCAVQSRATLALPILVAGHTLGPPLGCNR